MRRNTDRSPVHDSLSSTVTSGINNRSPSPTSFCCPASLATPSLNSSSVNPVMSASMRSVFPSASSFYNNRLTSTTGRLSPSHSMSSFYGSSAFTSSSAYAAAASLFGRSGGSSFPVSGHHPHHPLLHSGSTGSPGAGSIGSSSSSSSPHTGHHHPSLLTPGHHHLHHHPSTGLHHPVHGSSSSLSNPSTAAAVAHAYATQMMFNSSSLSQASAFSQALAAGQSLYSSSQPSLYFCPYLSSLIICDLLLSSLSFFVIWSRERVFNCVHPLLESTEMTGKASILVCFEKKRRRKESEWKP